MVAFSHGRNFLKPVLRVTLEGRGDPSPVILFIPPEGAKFDRAARLIKGIPKSRKKRIGWLTHAVDILSCCLVATEGFQDPKHPILDMNAEEIRATLKTLVLGEFHQPA